MHVLHHVAVNGLTLHGESSFTSSFCFLCSCSARRTLDVAREMAKAGRWSITVA